MRRDRDFCRSPSWNLGTQNLPRLTIATFKHILVFQPAPRPIAWVVPSWRLNWREKHAALSKPHSRATLSMEAPRLSNKVRVFWVYAASTSSTGEVPKAAVYTALKRDGEIWTRRAIAASVHLS
ncbi:hypothetical protein IAD21_00001 [Abditibacteriota bacterium]|nr:hypothetical protein IAD21_00001 [Abditibacteriota bacterium]